MTTNTLYNGDCLEVMKDIPDKSIDLVLCDLPYGYIESKWDVQIPMEKLWEFYKKVLRDGGSVLLFGNEPFASYIRMSNVDWYKYDWYWHKNTFANFPQAPYMPLKNIETISVFSEGKIAPNAKLKMNYYPQGLLDCYKEIVDRPCAVSFRPNRKPQSFVQTQTGYPKQLLRFDKDTEKFHPTQKPVALLEYLIKTYTKEGYTVLDNCMGSGSTGVACVNLNRNFIGIELEEKYFKIAEERINNAKKEERTNNATKKLF